MDQIKKVCFTGHRNISVTDQIKKHLYTVIEALIAAGAEDFYAGGALGWDMLCEKAVIGLKKKYPAIKLHLVLPCPPEEQTSRWNSSSVDEYYRLLKASDDRIIVSRHYSDSCMRLRNEKLTELSDCCVCYYTGEKSGTAQTVRFAEKKGIKIINIAAYKD